MIKVLKGLDIMYMLPMRTPCHAPPPPEIFVCLDIMYMLPMRTPCHAPPPRNFCMGGGVQTRKRPPIRRKKTPSQTEKGPHYEKKDPSHGEKGKTLMLMT